MANLEVQDFSMNRLAKKSRGRPAEVIDEPFAQALHKLAVDRGLGSQMGLARALGKKSNTAVNAWYRLGRMPKAAEFRNLLDVLRPGDEELKTLVKDYAEGFTTQQNRSPERGKYAVKLSKSPINQWVEGECQKRGFTPIQFILIIGLESSLNSEGRLRVDDDALVFLQERAFQVFNLSPEQVKELLRIASLEKQTRGEYITHNGEAAGRMLGTSRANVSLYRIRLGLPLHLTKDQVGLIRTEMQKRKDISKPRPKLAPAPRVDIIAPKGVIFAVANPVLPPKEETIPAEKKISLISSQERLQKQPDKPIQLDENLFSDLNPQIGQRMKEIFKSNESQLQNLTKEQIAYLGLLIIYRMSASVGGKDGLQEFLAQDRKKAKEMAKALTKQREKIFKEYPLPESVTVADAPIDTDRGSPELPFRDAVALIGGSL